MRLIQGSLCAAAAIFVSACASSGGARGPASAEEQFDLKNVYSMERSFWHDKRGGQEYYGRFSAFIVKDDMSQEGNARVLIYLEDPQTFEMKKVADNRSFLWSGAAAGTEPNLDVNRKNSLTITSGNDGIGRHAWHETITARYLASTGKVEVIGYDYDYYDKLGEENSYKCSYNFLTGKAEASVFDVKREREIKRKVQGVRGPVDLNAWTNDKNPKDCAPESR